MNKFNEIGLLTVVAGLGALLGAAPAPAAAWSPPVQLATDVSSYSGYDLLVDGKGRTVAMWTRFETLEQRLVSSAKPAGGVFSLPAVLSGDDDVKSWKAAASKKGTVTAVWTANDGVVDRVKVSDLAPKALQFTTATTISAMGQDEEYPSVGIDKKDNTIVSWENRNDTGMEVAIRPAKGVFGAIQEIAADREILQSKLAVGAGGHAVLAWRSDALGEENQVQASIRLPGGDFQPYQVVSDPMVLSGNPEATIDAKGNATVAFDPSRIANLTAGNTLFDASVVGSLNYNPIFRYDQKGNLYVFRTKIGLPYNKAGFSVRPVGSTTFGAEIEFGAADIDVYAGDMAVDKKGNVRVAWTEYAVAGSRVYTSYRPVNGAFGLAEPLTDANDDCYGPQVVIDKKGDTTLMYLQYDPDTLQTGLFATTLPRP